MPDTALLVLPPHLCPTQSGVYTKSRSILAIHNLKHQGVYSPKTYGTLDLPGGFWVLVSGHY